MKRPLEESGGWRVHPLIHSINPYGPLCGWGAGMLTHPEAAASYGHIAAISDLGLDTPLDPGMSLVRAELRRWRTHRQRRRTVVLDQNGPREFNRLTAQLLRT